MPALRTEIRSTELQRYVVRIDTTEGKVLGSGFFVAPGILLTCAHVVHGFAAVSVVANARFPQDKIPATVIARSASRKGRHGYWPFPDLAVLELMKRISHPCVRLDYREPAHDARCIAVGFSTLNDGLDPQGSPAYLQFEGTEGIGYYRLQGAEIEAGLSGAPLVCIERRAVVGVIAATRDRRAPHGGFASPTAALMKGINQDSELWGPDVWHQNQTTVLAEREAWNRVLPIPEAELELLRPWDFESKSKLSPADFLLPEVGMTPYKFRNDVLDEAVRWCKSSSSMGFWHIAGRGGSGKTRFATELCRRMADDGWICGFWRENSIIAKVRLPRLVVFDYAERYDPAGLAAILEDLQQRASDVAPVQILVLSRTVGGADPIEALKKRAALSLRSVLKECRKDLETAKLTESQRDELYVEAVYRFRNKWFGAERAKEAVLSRDLSGARYDLPLDVLFEALDAALGTLDHATASAWETPAERILVHESKYWEASAPRNLEESHLKGFVAAATLAGAQDDQEAASLVSLLEARYTQQQEIVTWLSKLYAGPKKLNPLRPDRLAETLVSSWLAEFEDGGRAMLCNILALESDTQTAQAVDTLARLSPRFAGVAEAIAASVAEALPALSLRAKEQAPGSWLASGDPTLAESLLRLLTVEMLERMTAAVKVQAKGKSFAELADAYFVIGECAYAAGNNGDAKRIHREALSVRESLLRKDTGDSHVQRNVGFSLLRLGDVEQSRGYPSDAWHFHERAFETRKALADTYPYDVEYQHDLAVSYDRLGVLASNAGRPLQAQAFFQESLRIGLDLAARDPESGRHQRNLAISYERLADLAQGVSNRSEASRLYLHALKIAQDLVLSEPENLVYQRDLAISFEQVGDQAREVGDLAEAVGRYTESLEIRSKLTNRDRGNLVYQRGLALINEKLGELARDAGNAEEAGRRFAHALDIYRSLAVRDRDSALYQRDLAASQYRLGDLARAAGNPKEARGRYAEALHIRRQLARQQPENVRNQRDLSASYHRLADLARIRGNFERAQLRYLQAIRIQQSLLRLDGKNASYMRDLAFSFHRLGDLARIRCHAAEARARYDVATEIRQHLVRLDESNVTYQRDLAFSNHRLGDLARGSGSVETAWSYYEKARIIRLRLVDRDPQRTGYKRDLGVSFHRLAGVAQASGKFDEAAKMYRDALDIREGLVVVDRRNGRFRRDLASTYFRFAEFTESLGNRPKAQRWYKKALAVRQTLAIEDATNANYNCDLRNTYDRLGDLRLEDESPREALNYYELALPLAKALIKSHPENASYREDLKILLAKIAKVRMLND